MSKSKFQRGQGSRRRRGQRFARLQPDRLGMPPAVAAVQTYGTTYRFTGNATSTAEASDCTQNMVRRALGMIATSSTNAYCPFVAFKVRRLKVWAITGNTTSELTNINQVTLNWAGQYAKSRLLTATCSTTVPAVISAVPPVGSSASFWRNGTSDDSETLFTISASTYTSVVVDMDISFNMWDTLTYGAIDTVTSSGMSAGVFARGYLDNAVAGSLSLAPEQWTAYTWSS